MPTKAICHYFHRDIIIPTLKTMNMGGDNIAELLPGTALVESRLTWRKQMGNGPARGLYQMEIATHDDIWDNYLSYRKSLADNVLQFKTSHKANAEEELINKATNYFADTICEFLPELGGKKLYECFVAAATQSLMHAEKEYDNNRDLIDLLAKKKK